MPEPVSAHEAMLLEVNGRDYYFLAIGFEDEPAFIGESATVELIAGTVDKKTANSLLASTGYEFPIDGFRALRGLYRSLNLEINVGEEKMRVKLAETNSAYRTTYSSSFIPTSVGPYFMHLFLTATDGTNLDVTVSCKSGGTHFVNSSTVVEELAPGVKKIYKAGEIPCPLSRIEGELPRGTSGELSEGRDTPSSGGWLDTVKSLENANLYILGVSGLAVIGLTIVLVWRILKKRNKVQY